MPNHRDVVEVDKLKHLADQLKWEMLRESYDDMSVEVVFIRPAAAAAEAPAKPEKPT